MMDEHPPFVRDLLSHAFLVIAEIRRVEPSPPIPTPSELQARRGLALVALYACFENGCGNIIRDGLSSIASSSSEIRRCCPDLQALALYGHTDAIRKVSHRKAVRKSGDFLRSSRAEGAISFPVNPFEGALQSCNGATILEALRCFGVNDFGMSKESIGRLGNLAERRNEVAHGRVSSAEAGRRATAAQLQAMHELVELELDRARSRLASFINDREYIVA